jgi:hypothetical protein
LFLHQSEDCLPIGDGSLKALAGLLIQAGVGCHMYPSSVIFNQAQRDRTEAKKTVCSLHYLL